MIESTKIKELIHTRTLCSTSTSYGICLMYAVDDGSASRSGVAAVIFYGRLFIDCSKQRKPAYSCWRDFVGTVLNHQLLRPTVVILRRPRVL